MPIVWTINSVDHTTDQLTITGHGFVTGDGPAAVRTVGGVLPTGLAPVTDYWIIRVDNNTIKLATSSANAIAGTAINLTANGSGTNNLEAGIPFRRARTYFPRATDVAGAQVKSADLNELMDAFVALHALLTGQTQSIWSGITLPPDSSMTVSNTGKYKHGDRTLHIPAAKFVGDSNNGLLQQGGYLTAAAAMIAYAPVELPAGKTIKSVTVYYNPNGGGAMQPILRNFNPSTGGNNAIWTGTSDSTGTAIESQTNSPDHEMIATHTYWVECLFSGAANRLYGAVIVYGEE